MPPSSKGKPSPVKRVVARMRTINTDIFLQVKDGSKTVETRAAAEKFSALSKGDVLVIICGDERLERTIKKVKRFPSIEAMIKEVPYKKIMPSVTSIEEMIKVYHSFPGYKDKIKKHGIVAMWV